MYLSPLPEKTFTNNLTYTKVQDQHHHQHYHHHRTYHASSHLHFLLQQRDAAVTKLSKLPATPAAAAVAEFNGDSVPVAAPQSVLNATSSDQPARLAVSVPLSHAEVLRCSGVVRCLACPTPPSFCIFFFSAPPHLPQQKKRRARAAASDTVVVVVEVVWWCMRYVLFSPRLFFSPVSTPCHTHPLRPRHQPPALPGDLAHIHLRRFCLYLSFLTPPSKSSLSSTAAAILAHTRPILVLRRLSYLQGCS